MKKSIIDDWIWEQIYYCGFKSVLRKFKLMSNKLGALIRSAENNSESSEISDIKYFIDCVVRDLEDTGERICNYPEPNRKAENIYRQHSFIMFLNIITLAVSMAAMLAALFLR